MNLALVHNSVAPAITTPSAAAKHDKLDTAAKQFAGILIDTLWSEFQNDPLATQPGEFSDPGAKNLKGLGLQAMSSAIAARGGLGMAQLIEHQLDPPAPLKPLPENQLTSLKSKPPVADMLVGAKPQVPR
ncbi:MAG: hypothetical protein ACRD0Y_02165 [Terriglobales bacterium]